MNTVEMAHGSGGQAMQQLINRLFMEAFNNPWLAEQEDQARIDLATLTAQGDRLAFSTDSYVIDPLFFPAAISASSPSAARPTTWRSAAPFRATSPAGLSSKRGCRWRRSRRWSTAWHRARGGIAIVTGDTKVVQRGAADKLFINTAGMGAIPADIHWGAQQLSVGDVLLVSGTLGCHGATILNLREGLGLDGELRSDCAVLTPLIQTLRAFPA
jgi:hydrogenase expression/formation protein HypE